MSENGEYGDGAGGTLPESRPGSTMLPPLATCEQARRSRDARFDGLFFTAVKTTGIYCRPVCPAPAAKSANVAYYPNAASAEAAGFRPCLRCRPELAPADGRWRRGDHLVARAVRMIDDGALDDASIPALARRLHVGERHLRRLFVDALGTTPQQLQATRRLLFAKQLLTESALPVTEVALAAGFRSLRRFNDAFVTAYGLAPGRMRKSVDAAPEGGPLTLKLAYRPPFDFGATLDFLRPRALPGVEHVGANSYRRLLDADGAWLEVGEWTRGEPALRLSLHGVMASALPAIVRQTRRMFDLDADPQTIHACLGLDRRLKPGLRHDPGLRLPGGWDGFEIAVRAILGQQVSVAAASTFAARVVAMHGHPLASPVDAHLHTLFPDAATLASADLSGIGLTRQRRDTLSGMARAVANGDVGFSADQSLEDFIARWIALPGIGDWTAHYLALRALGHPDAFPAGDLVLRRQLDIGTAVTEKTLRHHAEAWRPWRAYAAIHLWRTAATNTRTRA